MNSIPYIGNVSLSLNGIKDDQLSWKTFLAHKVCPVRYLVQLVYCWTIIAFLDHVKQDQECLAVSAEDFVSVKRFSRGSLSMALLQESRQREFDLLKRRIQGG